MEDERHPVRILIHSAPPWAPSGYGVQCALLAKGLRDAGHEVGISAYGGFIQEGTYWEGIRIYSCGGTAKGVGRISYNYKRHNADVVIVICDFWVVDARELDGMYVISWIPIDCEPLSMLDELQLNVARERCGAFIPVAMSEHGKRMLSRLDFDAPVIPHMVHPAYAPGSRSAWRKENGIPSDAFLISTVGVNGDYPCRKGFPETLMAFQVFAERHPEARLYMHTQISPGIEGVDLMEICKSLGLKNQVGFPDQLMRLSDLHGQDYMAGMMRASDVGSFAGYAEGFCVPAEEFKACGTPIVATRAAALAERDAAWWCATQPFWSKLHNRWWQMPIVSSLVDCYERAYREARIPGGARKAAVKSAERYKVDEVITRWRQLLLSGSTAWPGAR